MRIQTYERRLGINPANIPAVTPNIDNGDYGAGAAGNIQELAARMQKLQNDTEDARTLELFNQFKQETMNYHDNPDTGIRNTRLGYMASGIYQDADTWMRTKGEEYVQKIKSNRAKRNFRKMAGDFIVQQSDSNSRFEAQQIKHYQTEQADASIKNSLNYIEANYNDPKIIERERFSIRQALELKMRGSSIQAFNEEYAKIEDQIAVARIRQAFNDNPDMALALLDDKDIHLLPKTHAKLKLSLSKRVAQLHKKELENQRFNQYKDIAQSLIREFPIGQEENAYKKMRAEIHDKDDYQGVKQQFDIIRNEELLRRKNQKDAIKTQQKNFFANLEKQYYDNYQPVPSELLRQARDNDSIDDTQYRNALTRNKLLATRAGLEDQLERDLPHWHSLTPHEQDSIIMRSRGISENEHRDAFEYLKGRVLSGDATDSEINGFYENFYITKADKETLKGYRSKLNSTHHQAVQSAVKSLRSAVNALSLPQKEKAFYMAAAVNEFNNIVADIPPDDPKYNDRLKEAINSAFTNAVDMTGKSQSYWFFGQHINSFGQRVIQGQQIINDTLLPDIADIDYSPMPLDLNIPLPQRNRTQETQQTNDYSVPSLTIQDRNTQINSGQEQNIGLAMVAGGVIPAGGEFDSPRSYRKGIHNGLDVAAPEGSEIIMRDFGTPLSVVRVNTKTPSKGLGNSVHLRGTYSNGDTIEVSLGHMQNHSINIAAGQIVEPGTLIGKVGNTGMTSDREKGGITAWYEGKNSGFHLDIKIKINGKFVDPKRFKPPVNDSVNNATQSQQTSNAQIVNENNDILSDDIPSLESIFFADWGFNNSEDIF